MKTNKPFPRPLGLMLPCRCGPLLEYLDVPHEFVRISLLCLLKFIFTNSFSCVGLDVPSVWGRGRRRTDGQIGGRLDVHGRTFTHASNSSTYPSSRARHSFISASNCASKSCQLKLSSGTSASLGSPSSFRSSADGSAGLFPSAALRC